MTPHRRSHHIGLPLHPGACCVAGSPGQAFAKSDQAGQAHASGEDPSVEEIDHETQNGKRFKASSHHIRRYDGV
ncbi:hypothetical protein HAX54_051383 [Datura stramonium]|uniref:Uncharacterized protein n=1 Tax=Datura stramonium TaxID=4076 RepID=A0ABS8SYB2_DATST|nr:hypothetical protein [Datura stramonium]